MSEEQRELPSRYSKIRAAEHILGADKYPPLREDRYRAAEHISPYPTTPTQKSYTYPSVNLSPEVKPLAPKEPPQPKITPEMAVLQIKAGRPMEKVVDALVAVQPHMKEVKTVLLNLLKTEGLTTLITSEKLAEAVKRAGFWVAELHLPRQRMPLSQGAKLTQDLLTLTQIKKPTLEQTVLRQMRLNSLLSLLGFKSLPSPAAVTPALAPTPPPAPTPSPAPAL